MKGKELFHKVEQKLPNKVPAYPASGKAPTHLYVKILSNTDKFWYKKGEIYKVSNKIFWGFFTSGPSFAAHVNRDGTPQSGISLAACEILLPGTVLVIKPPVPEYTLEDLEKKVGHKFTLKIDV